MDGFADIHTHILPGVDDGAQDMPEALALVRIAYKSGTRAIVLTPHYRGKYKKNTPVWLREIFQVFSQLVSEEMPDMKLYLGSELQYGQEVPEGLVKQTVLAIHNTRYCLLEFGEKSLRSQVINGVAETVQHGYTPIIAHAERYAVFRKDARLADDVLSLGALIQLNTDSVMGKHGFRVKWYCAKLLSERKVHFIASDAHDVHKRPPQLQSCFRYVSKAYGSEYADRLFSKNAQKILDGKYL